MKWKKQTFADIGVFKYFAKFKGKDLCRSLFFKKLASSMHLVIGHVLNEIDLHSFPTHWIIDKSPLVFWSSLFTLGLQIKVIILQVCLSMYDLLVDARR